MTENARQEILEKWLKEHKGLIFKVVRAFTLHDHEDLFQEILIQVWHSIPAFREASSVSTWIYRISLNTATKWTRRERRHAGTAPIDQVQQLLRENSLAADDRLNWLYDEIYKLDEIDRSVSLLMLDGFSYKEMAAMLGISESNVGVKINRIKKHLISKSKNYHNDAI